MAKKLFNIFLIFLIWQPQQSIAQSYKDKLFFADSLFNSGELSSAFTLYEDITLLEENVPEYILIRLAFLEETSGNASSALFYLNKLMLVKPAIEILEKMDSLAEKHKLSGYEYRDIDFFLYLYRLYRPFIILFFIVISVVCFAFFLVNFLNKNRLKIYPAITLIWLGITACIINLDFTPDQAIVTKNNTYLMTAPSAGGHLAEIIGNGHRVTLKKKKDIWYQIEWKGKEVYIHESNLLFIH
ncbi:MAG: SH3 domain-containing protein [Cytophagaceae bacterium]